MADTNIEWADRVWNPVVGCTPCATGCLNCYAAQMARRLAAMGQREYVGLTVKRSQSGGTTWADFAGSRDVFNGTVRCLPERLEQPLHWRKPCTVFVNSMSDLFHSAVPFEFVHKAYVVMRQAKHTFIVLTKRPERRAEFYRWEAERAKAESDYVPMPLPNVIEGMSASTQADYDNGIGHLRDTPAACRMISFEPLLGPINADLTGIGWVIVGGESGPHARPMHPAWAKSIRDQCKAAGVPFFFKWGEWAHTEQAGRPAIIADKRTKIVSGDGSSFDYTSNWNGQGGVAMARVGKKRAGRLLDGVEHSEFPKLEAANGH